MTYSYIYILIVLRLTKSNIMISPKLIIVLVIAFFSTSINSTDVVEEPKIEEIISIENCASGNCFLTGCLDGTYACVTYGHEDYECTSCNNECPDVIVEGE